MKTPFFSTVILIATSMSGMVQDEEQKTIIQKDKKGIVQSVEYSSEDKSVPIPKSADKQWLIVND